MDGDMNTNSVTKLSNRSWWSAQLSNISKVFFTISEIIDYVILLTVCFVFITAYGTTFSTERFPSCPNYHRMIQMVFHINLLKGGGRIFRFKILEDGICSFYLISKEYFVLNIFTAKVIPMLLQKSKSESERRTTSFENF